MPRPGPRPYECVRRTWHSDRHQPIRGSLIQEIFRIATEVHTTATKKNKEWQEKLPIVVLKAEEIMYSRANSEAEYMDLKTLGDRTNDAINTIIRLDESTETGEFLQPCVEAALQLGCTPRRSSRSQQNNPPTCYLGPRNLTPCPLFSGGLLETIPTASWCFGPSSNLGRQTVASLSGECPKSQIIGFQSNVPRNREVGSTNFRCIKDYGSLPSSSNHASVGHLTGLPSLYTFSAQHGKQSESLIGHKSDQDDRAMSSGEVECDLSLRLGSLSSTSNIENKPKNGIAEPHNWLWAYLNSYSGKRNEHHDTQITSTKRKSSMGVQNFDDHNDWWQPKVPRYESPSVSKPVDESIRL